MSEPVLTKMLSELISNYSEGSDLKELCINLRESGALSIGGRKMLISEMVERQPYEETVACIQVIFASSSNDYSFDEQRDNNAMIEKLREKLIDEKSGNLFREALVNFSHENLLSVAPLLKKITFESKW